MSPPEQNALSPAPLIITSFTPSSCIHQNSSNHFISSILGILAQGGEKKNVFKYSNLILNWEK